MSEWQPIETAPKDGSLVLLYAPMMLHVDWKIVMGRYDRFQERWIDDSYSHIRAIISHWMPLPAPPTTTSKEAGE